MLCFLEYRTIGAFSAVAEHKRKAKYGSGELETLDSAGAIV